MVELSSIPFDASQHPLHFINVSNKLTSSTLDAGVEKNPKIPKMGGFPQKAHGGRGLVNGTEKSSTRCIICVWNVFL